MKQYLLLVLVFFQFVFCFSQQESVVAGFLKNGVEAYSKGNYEQAIELFKKCIVLSKQTKNTKILSNAYNDLGNSYTRTGKSELALTNFLLSIEIFKQNKDNINVAKTYKNIGALYAEQKDFVSAMQYYENAFEIAKRIENKGLMADCLNNMGVVYEQQIKYNKALDVYSRALKIYKLEGDQNKISMVLNNLAIVYKYLGNYPKSIMHYEEAIGLSKMMGNKFMVCANQNNLGNVYALTGDQLKSLELCQLANANAKAIDAQEVIIESYEGISTAYEKLHQYPNAIKYRKLFEAEKDNFINSNRSGQLAEMQVKFETQKKMDEIKLLRQEGKIRDLKIKNQNFQITKKNNLIIAFFLLLFAMAITAYFWKSKQTIKNKLIQEKMIWDTEEHERLRIAKDIHDDLGSGLSKINFLSEIIFQKTEHLPELRNSSEAVKETAKKMIDNMRDLIWALNPENTTLANLIARMREFTSDYLEDLPIEPIFSIPDNISQSPINKESHRELFMVVKEALNNISKHSKATSVFFDIVINDDIFLISIKDDGIGFNWDINPNGNGLRNMQSRISAIGGVFNISARNGQGTEISVLVSLNKILKN